VACILLMFACLSLARAQDFKYTSIELEDDHEAQPSQHFDAIYELLSDVKSAQVCTQWTCANAIALLIALVARSQPQIVSLCDALLRIVSGRSPRAN